MNEDVKLVEYAEVLLVHLGYDTESPEFEGTARRYATMLRKYQAKERVEPGSVIGSEVTTSTIGTTVTLAAIPFNSMCSKHFMPISGVVGIVYTPKALIPDTSAVVNAVKFYTRRFINQAEATFELCKEVNTAINAYGTAVVVAARHSCEEVPAVITEGFIGSVDRGLINSLRAQLERCITA